MRTVASRDVAMSSAAPGRIGEEEARRGGDGRDFTVVVPHGAPPLGPYQPTPQPFAGSGGGRRLRRRGYSTN